MVLPATFARHAPRHAYENIEEIRRQLRHKRIESTLRYIQPPYETVRDHRLATGYYSAEATVWTGLSRQLATGVYVESRYVPEAIVEQLA